MPRGGWAGALTNSTAIDIRGVNFFQVNQQRAGSLVAFDPTISRIELGSQPMRSRIGFENLSLVLQELSTPSFLNATSNSGLLDTIASRFYIDYIDANNKGGLAVQIVPRSIFRFPYYNISEGKTADDLDDYISKSIADSLATIALLAKDGLRERSATQAKNNLFVVITELLKDLPYGNQ
jgi:hypothetical protein